MYDIPFMKLKRLPPEQWLVWKMTFPLKELPFFRLELLVFFGKYFTYIMIHYACLFLC